MTKITQTIAFLAVIVGLASGANAASTGTTYVKQVEFRQNTTTPDLIVQTGASINYQASIGYSPGCSIVAATADSVKTWASLAQASLLTGKNVTIYYNSCNSVNWIYDIVLTR